MMVWLKRVLGWFHGRSRAQARAAAAPRSQLPPLPPGDWHRTRWPGIYEKPLSAAEIQKLEERAGLRTGPWLSRNTNRRWLK